MGEAQTRVFGADKGTTLSSLAVLNQGTHPIVALASNDGSIKLRKLVKSYENRLEIQDKVLTSWKVPLHILPNKQNKNDIKIIWNEEILACSFRDGISSSAVMLWDGIQEKKTGTIDEANSSLSAAEITCLALMGEESLKRGPLLIGCDDGSIVRLGLQSFDSFNLTQSVR